MRVAVAGYWRQLNAGRHFLHEHPAKSDSWKMTEVEELARDPRVFKVQGPMCNWNLKGADDEGSTGYVRKETIWLTSSEELAKTLQGVCQNMKGRTMHRHAHLIGGEARTSAAAAYTPELVNGVLKAFRRQLQRDGDEMALRAFGAGAVAAGAAAAAVLPFAAPLPAAPLGFGPPLGFGVAFAAAALTAASSACSSASLRVVEIWPTAYAVASSSSILSSPLITSRQFCSATQS